MEHHGTSWNIMKRHGTSWNIMKHHGLSWNPMEDHVVERIVERINGLSESLKKLRAADQ